MNCLELVDVLIKVCYTFNNKLTDVITKYVIGIMEEGGSKMFEIVPSQWMKKCFEEIDFAFTDFQKAMLQCGHYLVEKELILQR